MCGIAGFFNLHPSNVSIDLRQTCERMGQALFHRGPDGGDIWVDDEMDVGLAHRRLAIIDLSEAGHQPMTSHNGRFVMVYNGEVYNAPDLRQKLEAVGHIFKGHSDTEVILNGFAEWGIHETVSQMIGMFAIALWDRQQKELFLIRDRLGIKPVYWSFKNGLLLFGSELKALRQHPTFDTTIDQNAIASYLRHNYIPAPNSIYQHCKKLEPGQILSLKQGSQPVITSYWSMDQVIAQDQTQLSFDEAVEELDTLLRDAVKRRMISDVPLGAFLSGGIDSSTVAAMMQAQSSVPVKTFSIGFEDEGYNEAQHAAEVAKHLETDHTELYVSPQQAQSVIPNLATYYDEPFSDSSQIPTYLVSKLTKEHVTVALSGDGGDELFGGYNRYFLAQKYAEKLYNIPKGLRKLGAGIIQTASPQSWDTLFRLIPKNKRPAHAGDKLYKVARLLKGDMNDLYLSLISHWEHPNQIVKGSEEYKGLVWDKSLGQKIPNFVQRMQYLDSLTYLPDDILTKVDRASMAVALEARVPILDHRVVEFAWRLPQDFKIHQGQGKWILRQVLDKYVPKTLIDRPKMGFGVPIDQWLRGPLKEWAGDLLHSQNPHLNQAPIIEKWNEHLKGDQNWQYLLWDILMLQAWFDEWTE